MFKGLGDLASMMQQAQQMGERMRAMEDSLKQQVFVGSSGGDLIRAEVSGGGELLRLQIDPQLIQQGDREVMEDLIPAAVNQAFAKLQTARAEAMQAVLPQMNVPGVQDMLSQLLKKD